MTLLKGCTAALFFVATSGACAVEPECPTLSLNWQTSVYSSLGMTREGLWVNERLRQPTPHLRLFGQQGFEASTCVKEQWLQLGREGAVSYRGGLNVLKLSLSKASWDVLVPTGREDLSGEATRWKWWYFGVPITARSDVLSGQWTLRPKLIALVDYYTRALNGVVTHDEQGVHLSAAYSRTGMSTLGFLRDRRETAANPGVALDFSWQGQWGSARLDFEAQNFLSAVKLEGAWWANTHYQLSLPSESATTRSFTESNEVNGRYGQTDLWVRLPRAVRLKMQGDWPWIKQTELAWVGGQWHASATQSWPLGPGRFSLRVQDMSMLMAAYRWDLPWGKGNAITVGWAWSRWGSSQPLVLQARMAW